MLDQKRTEIGVIIGRFQVAELHDAHVELIETVLSKHDKVIVLLGTTTAINTRKNPLDFITRKLMMEEAFPDKFSAILPLPDQRSDYVWSNQIHKKVREIFPSGDVTLYGSRDSFIPYYHGTFNTCEFEPKSYVSATMTRGDVSRKALKSREFRSGVIYSVYSQYPTTFSTIDVAILRDNEILLGRKEHEDKWRLIGGFVDPTDESDIAACKREAREETGLEIGDLKFVCSKKIKDWRYSNITDRGVMTRFYVAKYIFGAPEPNDDIVELKWFKTDVVKEESFNNIVPEHKELLNTYFNSLL